MKTRLKRMMRLLAELKKRQFVTIAAFCRLLEAEEFTANGVDPVSSRTIRRDIALLCEVFKVPIVYDPSQRGYEMKDKFWRLPL